MSENNQPTCRFCLVDIGCKNISKKYYSSGQWDLYGEMINYTFNIQIPCHVITCTICERCIARLKDAKSFKDLVLQRLGSLSMCYALGTKELPNADPELKLEDFRDEALTNNCYKESGETDGSERNSDDDTLADIKIELNNPDSSNVNQTVEIKVSDDVPLRRPGIKKNREKNHVNSKTEKDWLKIAERRGHGPLLRETTIKLIANSTACVFQWNKSRYRCFCCTEPFSDFKLLREHTDNFHTPEHVRKKIIAQQNRLVKAEISTLYCKICGVRLEDLVKLREHLKGHGLQFESEEDLLVPFRIGQSNLQCQICNQNFTLFRLLNIHMNKHYQKQVCHICGAGFSNLVFLNLHKSRSHRSFACKDCKIVFKDKTAKKQHDINVHKVTTDRKRRFPCPYCQERFFQENFRVQHLVDTHGMIKPEYKCNVCPKVFITKSLRNNHVKKVHLKEKNNECDVCHHLFYTKSDVMRHRVTHTGDKRFSCSICSNLFSTKDSLRRHLKRTHGGVA